ncbi:hypothetical protein ACFORL_10480 [Legionella dresdenensis]|uniref:Flagellar biosynthetic protein FliO n=1 Tax=Legionella dresdenensis TaxID=450200 RepID=A0ABV8CH22_9GAMM
MNKIWWLIALFFIRLPTAFADGQAAAFKQPVTPKPMYLVTVLLLLVIALAFARKNKTFAISKSDCQLVEKKYLGNKTIVYIIEYQQQRFLLASTTQSLAIQPLSYEVCHETK